MKKHIYDEKNGLSYTLHGDYYLPGLVLNEEEPTYGKYGMLRKQYRDAREQVEMLMKQMAEEQSVTETLKIRDQMKWVGLMNNIRTSAEKIVLKEIVYI